MDVAVSSVSEKKKGLQRKGFSDCLCILQRGFQEIYKYKTTPSQDVSENSSDCTQTLSCSQSF